MSMSPQPLSSMPWPEILTVMAAVFLIGLAPTTLYAAIPHLAGYFAISSDTASRALLPGTVLFFVGLALAPWLAKWIGARRLIVLATATFILTSLAGALSTFPILILAVALRGLASGFLLSCGLGTLATAMPAERRAGMLGLLFFIHFLGRALGPMTGGWLTDNLAFAWTMLVFVPAGSVLLVLQLLFVSNSTLDESPPKQGWSQHRS